MKQRVWSLLLATLLLLSAMPLSVFADGVNEITRVEIDATNLSAPQYGQPLGYPTMDVTVGAPARVNQFRWMRDTGSGWERVSSKDIVVPGSYFCFITIRIDEDDANTHRLVDPVTVSVNGVEWEAESTTHGFNYSYTQVGVSSPVWVVDEPYSIKVVGGGAYFAEKVTEAYPGSVLQLKLDDNTTSEYPFGGWYGVRTDTGEEIEIREAQTRFFFTMPDAPVEIRPRWIQSAEVIAPPDKTEYNEGDYLDLTGMTIQITYLDGGQVQLSGDAIKPYVTEPSVSGSLSADCTEIVVQYREGIVTQPITVNESSTIESVDFTLLGFGYGLNVADVEVRINTEHVSFTTAGNVENYDIDRWNGSSSTVVTTGTFGKSYEYDLTIAFTLDSGYVKAFTADSITLNGIKARSVKSLSGKYLVSFALPGYEVSSAAADVTELTTAMRIQDVVVSVPLGAPYVFARYGQWIKLNDNTVVTDDAYFESGMTYRTTLYFAAAEGFALTENVAAVSGTVNGNYAAATLEDGYLVLTYDLVAYRDESEVPNGFTVSGTVSGLAEDTTVRVSLHEMGLPEPAYEYVLVGNGDYVIEDVLPGIYIVKAVAEGYKEYTTALVADSDVVQDIAMEPLVILYDIRGTVSRMDGDQSVWIYLLKDGVSLPVNEALVDGNGDYVLEDVQPGVYTITASANGYEDYEELVIVKDDTIHDIEMRIIATRYVITFALGDTPVSWQEVIEGETAEKPEDPALEGMVFCGWYAGDTLYDFSLPVTEDITLVARFEAESTSKPGDLNGDGAINNRDMALLQQYINKWDVTIDLDAADVNDDGAVNNRDLALLQQYINKWDVVLK